VLKIAGITILYYPDESLVSNILSYLNQIEVLYIIDNSDEPNKNIINDLRSNNKILLIENKGNKGIAAALNKAALKAIDDNYDLLLTMDQDSVVSDNYVNNMLDEFEKDEKIGILSPFVIHAANPREPQSSRLEKVMVAMTSGCIIRLSAYLKVGGFLEKLFIDYVDNEFCLRMISSGYKVFQLNSVSIYHKLGSTEGKQFIYRKVFPTNHSPIRWYYRTRNRLYVYKKYRHIYPHYVRFDVKVFLKDFFKILLYESNKIKKLTMIIRGYLDYKRDKFGKFTR
jgi:rhamnosyltransferase